jgi:hypothetical protein
MLAAETLTKLPELTVEQAEHWIAAALAEARALRQYDEHLYPRLPDDAALQVANPLHEAWRRWLDAAEALYARVRPLLRRHVAGAHDLDYAIARARAMVEVTPETMQARRDQVARGETKSLEEVRRELRAASGR